MHGQNHFKFTCYCDQSWQEHQAWSSLISVLPVNFQIRKRHYGSCFTHSGILWKTATIYILQGLKGIPYQAITHSRVTRKRDGRWHFKVPGHNMIAVILSSCKLWIYLESSEMWCWKRMEKISWTDHVRNEDVLLRVNEQRNILHEISKWKANWIGHILRRNYLLLKRR